MRKHTYEICGSWLLARPRRSECLLATPHRDRKATQHRERKTMKKIPFRAAQRVKKQCSEYRALCLNSFQGRDTEQISMLTWISIWLCTLALNCDLSNFWPSGVHFSCHNETVSSVAIEVPRSTTANCHLTLPACLQWQDAKNSTNLSHACALCSSRIVFTYFDYQINTVYIQQYYRHCILANIRFGQ